jgi:hypothetical protein
VSQRDAKHLADLRLADACAREGCPLCRCARQTAERYLAALLQEQVTDPATRRHLRESWGLCGPHARVLAGLPDAALGAAILGQDLLGLAIRRFGRGGAGVGAWLAPSRAGAAGRSSRSGTGAGVPVVPARS